MQTVTESDKSYNMDAANRRSLANHEFQTTYADVVCEYDQHGGVPAEAMARRRLKWRGERAPLADVAEQYTAIHRSYNEFEPGMITELDRAFPNSGIEAEPARENSVCIYLYVPDLFRDQVESYVKETFHADEIDWIDGALRIWWD